jgi:hypothetical protein
MLYKEFVYKEYKDNIDLSKYKIYDIPIPKEVDIEKLKSFKVYNAVINTSAIDSDGEVVLPEGFKSDRIMQNPITLLSHGMDVQSTIYPIGRILQLAVGKDDIIAKYVFDENDPEAVKIKNKYDTGFMSMFSVGFIPYKYLRPSDFNEQAEICIKTADGRDVKYDTNPYKNKVKGIIPSWEMLEFSCVSIGANPNARLIRSKAMQILEKYNNNPVLKEIAERDMNKKVNEILSGFSILDEYFDKYEIKGVVPFEATKIDLESAWDGDKAMADAAKWASSDNSGDKEKMDWSKYARVFAWFNTEAPDNFTSYKLPMYFIKDNELILSKKAVDSVYGILNGAMEGVDIPKEDKDAIMKNVMEARDLITKEEEKSKPKEEAKIAEKIVEAKVESKNKKEISSEVATEKPMGNENGKKEDEKADDEQSDKMDMLFNAIDELKAMIVAMATGLNELKVVNAEQTNKMCLEVKELTHISKIKMEILREEVKDFNKNLKINKAIEVKETKVEEVKPAEVIKTDVVNDKKITELFSNSNANLSKLNDLISKFNI